jgi:hypothetical protein
MTSSTVVFLLLDVVKIIHLFRNLKYIVKQTMLRDAKPIEDKIPEDKMDEWLKNKGKCKKML